MNAQWDQLVDALQKAEAAIAEGKNRELELKIRIAELETELNHYKDKRANGIHKNNGTENG